MCVEVALLMCVSVIRVHVSSVLCVFLCVCVFVLVSMVCVHVLTEG